MIVKTKEISIIADLILVQKNINFAFDAIEKTPTKKEGNTFIEAYSSL